MLSAFGRALWGDIIQVEMWMGEKEKIMHAGSGGRQLVCPRFDSSVFSQEAT